jgi:hypothetical protein
MNHYAQPRNRTDYLAQPKNRKMDMRFGTVSGQGPVAGCCGCGDEPSGSCATELVRVISKQLNCIIQLYCNDYPKGKSEETTGNRINLE